MSCEVCDTHTHVCHTPHTCVYHRSQSQVYVCVTVIWRHHTPSVFCAFRKWNKITLWTGVILWKFLTNSNPISSVTWSDEKTLSHMFSYIKSRYIITEIKIFWYQVKCTKNLLKNRNKKCQAEIMESSNIAISLEGIVSCFQRILQHPVSVNTYLKRKRIWTYKHGNIAQMELQLQRY